MVFTNVGKSGLALAFAGSMTIPDVIGIGSGSGAVSASDTNLVAQTRVNAFTSRTISTQKEVTFLADFSATQMSGLNLREFGVRISGGTLFNREGFAAINFDGSNEAQIEVTFECF